MTTATSLAARFGALGAPLPLLEEVARAYATPGRAYHDLSHVEEMLGWFEVVRRDVGWSRPREVGLAVLFHDAVYVPSAKDNEAKSAELAKEAIARHGLEVDAERVAELILLTARHASLRASDVDAEAALFLDCDMAILAASPERFDAYDRAIAAEYAFVPADAYAAGRRAFLERVLASEHVYLSEWGRATLESRARANVARALGR